MKHITLAALLCAASTVAASAATYNYSYTFDTGAVLSGSLDGTLATDMNTITVTGMDQPLLDGADFGLVLTQFGAWSDFYSGTAATVSLDGSIMDVVFVEDTFSAGFGLSTLFSDAVVVSPTAIFDDPYNAANWSIEEATAPVPLPASGLMLGFAMLGAGYAARRKAGQI